MKRFLPLLVTAFVGTVPSREDASPTAAMSREFETNNVSPHSKSAHRPTFKAWIDPRRIDSPEVYLHTQSQLGRLTRDAIDHWHILSRTSASSRGRWEARRRELAMRAWATDHRASLARLQRIANPHRLSFYEICQEFDLLSDKTG